MLPPQTPNQRVARAVRQVQPGVTAKVRSSSPQRVPPQSGRPAASGGGKVIVVDEITDLPDPATVDGQLFYVRNATC